MLLGRKNLDRSLRLMLFAAFWSAVNRGLRPRGTLYFLVSKVARKPRRCRGSFVPFFRKKYRSQSATGVVCRFWSAVNRGLRPRGTLYILTAKSTKNSPADAFAYFVPSNVRNGRLFAGLQANRPRFLPLLAGTSFRGSGIGPGPFAAVLSFRPGKEANTRTKDVRPCSRVRMFAQNRAQNRTESKPKLPAAM